MVASRQIKMEKKVVANAIAKCFCIAYIIIGVRLKATRLTTLKERMGNICLSLAKSDISNPPTEDMFYDTTVPLDPLSST